MAFEPDLWHEFFEENHFPMLPCPTCKTGRLSNHPAFFKSEGATHYTSADLNELPEDYVRRAFVAIAKCGNGSCGEVVSVAGEYIYVESDTGHGWGLSLALRPKCMVPAPPLIPLTDEMPRGVALNLTRSFELFWMDFASCANGLRTVCEYILDHLDVPRDGTSKKGKPVAYDLNGRIQILARRRTHKPNAALIDALRIIGNLGSHGKDVTHLHLMTAYSLMDLLVQGLFSKAKATALRKLARKIVKSKGEAYY
ncbi:hypothetical protein AB7M17_006018 [Bradyrhizobium sp. USDA 377]